MSKNTDGEVGSEASDNSGQTTPLGLAYCLVFYPLSTVPGILLLFSCGTMTDGHEGPNLMRAIIGLGASLVLSVIGLVSAVIAASIKSPLSRGLFIATGIAAAPGLIMLVLCGK